MFLATLQTKNKIPSLTIVNGISCTELLMGNAPNRPLASF